MSADIRRLSDDYAVAPQIDPADLDEIRAAGFTTVICNRPDGEVPPSHQAEAIGAAARAAGLAFVEVPIANRMLDEDTVAAHAAARAASDGPVLAYCASGTRSTIVWALGEAGRRTPEDLLAAAEAAGYALGMIYPELKRRAEAG